MSCCGKSRGQALSAKDRNRTDKIWKQRDAMADSLKKIVCFLVLAVVLASCTGTDIQNAALGAAKNWIQLHSPQYCSVNDESPAAR
jgi:hypothetical protein